MVTRKKKASPVTLNEYDRQYLKEEIEQAGGSEVLSAAVCVAPDQYSDNAMFGYDGFARFSSSYNK